VRFFEPRAEASLGKDVFYSPVVTFVYVADPKEVTDSLQHVYQFLSSWRRLPAMHDPIPEHHRFVDFAYQLAREGHWPTITPLCIDRQGRQKIAQDFSNWGSLYFLHKPICCGNEFTD
jgi:hypothetical protein